jgi:hypothetical protein
VQPPHRISLVCVATKMPAFRLRNFDLIPFRWFFDTSATQQVHFWVLELSFT